jgi:hypothetical protein
MQGRSFASRARVPAWLAALAACLWQGMAAASADETFNGLRVSPAGDGAGEVALFRAETAMDLPGGASVVNRLEVQCGGGEVFYVMIDFGTPRLSEHTATMDVRLEQRFGAHGGVSREGWRVSYDVLAGSERRASVPGDLRNLQLNRMVYMGDHSGFVARLVEADYLGTERPAADGGGFLFELSHLAGDTSRLRRHCGV